MKLQFIASKKGHYKKKKFTFKVTSENNAAKLLYRFVNNHNYIFSAQVDGVKIEYLDILQGLYRKKFGPKNRHWLDYGI